MRLRCLRLRRRAAEFHTLLSGCGIYDLSWRTKIAVTGGDRVRWMNGMVSNKCAIWRRAMVYAFLLNAQGRINRTSMCFSAVSLCWWIRRGAQREKVLQLFDRYIIADDVEIADASDRSQRRPDWAAVARSSRTRQHNRPRIRPAVCRSRVGICGSETTVTLLRSGEEARQSCQVWTTPQQMSILRGWLITAGARPSVRRRPIYSASRGHSGMESTFATVIPPRRLARRAH